MRPKKLNPKPAIALKSLFWTTVSGKELEDSIWDLKLDAEGKVEVIDNETVNPMEISLKPTAIDDSVVDINIEKIHELFAKKIKPKPNDAGGGGGGGGSTKKGLVTLVDGKKQQNVGISLSRFSQRGLTSAEIARALLHCDENVLTSDVLSSMLKILPSKEDMEMCKSYEGDVNRLGKVEQFFRHLADVPHCSLRVDAMIAKHVLGDQTEEVRARLAYHEQAGKQVRNALDVNNGTLRKLLALLLRVGNYVNGGTRRGGAYGMKLDAVSKIASVKSSDNKSDLLRYCASEMIRLHGADSIMNVGRELNSLENASKAPLDEIKSSIAKISKGIQLITTCLEKNLSKEIEDEDKVNEGGGDGEGGEGGGEGEGGGGEGDKGTKGNKTTKSTNDSDQQTNSTSVDRCFTHFLTYAEGVRDGLSQRFKSMEEEGQRVVKMFAEDSKKVSSSEVYSKLVASVKLLEKAHGNNKRAVEQLRKAEQRAAKLTQAAADKSAKKEGADMFEEHDLFQSGGANDIVARVRKRNFKRQNQALNVDKKSSSFDDDDNEDGGCPPPPPKPPPSLANKFNNSNK